MGEFKSRAWTENLQNIKIFIDYLNAIQPTIIKFTSSHCPTKVRFFDVNISLTTYGDGSINTDLYTKSTNKHRHLLYQS